MLTLDTQPAMSEPVHILEQQPEGMRPWSLGVELDWWCFHHSRGKVVAYLNEMLGKHDLLVVDCQGFKRKNGW